jgi:hypothetical protein
MTANTALSLYAYLDHPLTALAPNEAHLVVSMRIWAKAAMARTCPLRLVAPRFVLSGQGQSMVPFHAFMMALGQSAARAVILGCCENGPITEDEALILLAADAVRGRNLQSARLAMTRMIRADCLGALVHKISLFVASSNVDRVYYSRAA